MFFHFHQRQAEPEQPKQEAPKGVQYGEHTLHFVEALDGAVVILAEPELIKVVKDADPTLEPTGSVDKFTSVGWVGAS